MTASGVGTPAADGNPSAPPEPRRPHWHWLLGCLVFLALGGLGFVAAQLFRAPTHEVPSLAGFDEAEVARLTAGFDWQIDVQRVRSDEQPQVGRIIRTAPVAGEPLAEGEPFLVVVSAGPELRALPDLSRRPLSDSETALAELDLVALPAQEAFDEEVPLGAVVSWSVPADPSLAAGAGVEPGTEVALVVSAGPAPRVLPDLSDLSIVDATAQLVYRRLIVTLAPPVFSDTVPVDGVIAMEPAAGATVERGATVVLTPSLGVDLVELPDLAGQTLAQMQATLAAAGLQIGALLGSTQGTFESASVNGEEADAGDELRRGTPVDLVVL